MNTMTTFMLSVNWACHIVSRSLDFMLRGSVRGSELRLLWQNRTFAKTDYGEAVWF